jgi:Cell wall protein YJL171C/Tos1, N-terminal
MCPFKTNHALSLNPQNVASFKHPFLYLCRAVRCPLQSLQHTLTPFHSPAQIAVVCRHSVENGSVWFLQARQIRYITRLQHWLPKMKNFGAMIVVAALLLVGNVVADMCSMGSKEVSGNWFCQPVKAIRYSNVGSSGSYNQITDMNVQSGSCQSQPKSYAGPLAPLDEEVSRSRSRLFQGITNRYCPS